MYETPNIADIVLQPDDPCYSDALSNEARPFARLLEQDREEPLQAFLSQNPRILLDTLPERFGTVSLPKFRFGTAYVSDYVLVGGGSGRIFVTLVELEPATARAFTKKGTFAARLNEAIRQVNSWASWIDENEMYFRATLHDALLKANPTFVRIVGSPRDTRTTLLIDSKIVIGRSYALSEDANRARRQLYKRTSRSLEIVHYDRLLHAHVARIILAKLASGSTSAKVLCRLASSTSERLRTCVAQHTNTDAKTLARLMQDPSEMVRASIASLPRATTEMLSVLAEDGSREVRDAVVRNSAAPPELISLAAPSRPASLKIAISRQDCPQDVLDRAFTCGDINVVVAAARHPMMRNLQLLQKVLQVAPVVVRKNIALNPNLDETLVRTLQGDTRSVVRENVKATVRGIEKASEVPAV